MGTIRRVSVLGSTLACALARAAEPSAGLPAPVAAQLEDAAGLCRDGGGKPFTTDAVKRADLNGDGREDFVLYLGWIRCDDAASIYGDREKGVTVFVGGGASGATEAFSDSVFDASIEGGAAPAKLWLTVSGAQCGKPPARDFASENFCERALVWNAKASRLEYAPVATVRMIH